MIVLGFQSPGPFILKTDLINIRWYGVLIAIAVLIGLNLSQYLAKKRNVNPDLIGDLVIWLIIGALPGARLYYVLFQWQEYARHPGDIIAIWQGGIAIHGAIIGGAIAATLFARWQKVSVWQLADLVAPSLILGQAIGRWGNFFNSEAFGAPTDLPWKLYIPCEPNNCNRPLEYIDFAYFHPTFLYESIWNLGVFALLIWLFFWGIKQRESLKLGTIALVYLIAYSSGRIWIEGLRTDSLMLGDWRIAQIISLIAIILGVFGLIWLYKFNRPLPDVIGEESRQESDGRG